MAEKEVQESHAPLKVRLEKTHRGYSWTILVEGQNLDEVLPKLNEANEALQKQYGHVTISMATL